MMNVKKLILQICFVLIPIVNSAQHQFVCSYNGTNKIHFVDKNIFKVGKLYRTWIKTVCKVVDSLPNDTSKFKYKYSY